MYFLHYNFSNSQHFKNFHKKTEALTSVIFYGNNFQKNYLVTPCLAIQSEYFFAFTLCSAKVEANS
jgi:hypothetical protein